MATFAFDIPEEHILSWVSAHILREYFEEPEEDDDEEPDDVEPSGPISFGEASSLPGGPRLVHAIRKQINEYVAAKIDRLLSDKLDEKIDAMVTSAVDGVLRNGFATYTSWGTKGEVKTVEHAVREALFSKESHHSAPKVTRIVDERVKAVVDAEVKAIVASQKDAIRVAMADAAAKAITAAVGPR